MRIALVFSSLILALGFGYVLPSRLEGHAITQHIDGLSLTALGKLIERLLAPSELIRWPDTIFINGNIVTMDDHTTAPTVGRTARAMAIRDGKIVTLGANDEVLWFKGPDTKVIDLKGMTVMPGLVEPHVHPRAIKPNPPGVYIGVRIADTVEESLERIREAIKGADPRPGEWIFLELHPDPGISIRDIDLAVQRWIADGTFTNKQLTEVAPNNPLFLTAKFGATRPGEMIRIETFDSKSVMVSWYASDINFDLWGEDHPGIDGHHGSHRTNVLNEMGMQEVLKAIPYFKDAIVEAYGEKGERYAFSSGEADGLVDAVFHLGQVEIESVVKQLISQQERLAAAGITSFMSRSGGGLTLAQALHHMARNDLLVIRMAFLADEMNRIMNTGVGKAAFSLIAPVWGKGPDSEGRGAKFWYAGITSEVWDSTGPNVCFGSDLPVPRPELSEAQICQKPGSRAWEVFKAALKAGGRLTAIHTVGSHAARTFVQMIEEAMEESPVLTIEHIRDLRLFGAHSYVIGKQPDVLEKLKEYGIIIPINANRALSRIDGLWVLENYGQEVERFLAPVRSYIEAGIMVTGEAEIPAPRPTDYFEAMSKYVTRLGDDGRVYVPEEAVPPEIALKLMTNWAARALYAEHLIGSLEPSKFADFLILNKNILDTPPEEWNTIRPLATFVGGKSVWIEPELKAELGL